MPIRFRCQYCNQLLGISRRKAGTTVQCPTCRAQVMVPAAGLDDPELGDRPATSPLFEHSDFEAAFQLPTAEGPPDLPVPPVPSQPFQFPPASASSALKVERVGAPPAPPQPAPPQPAPAPAAGVLLSPAQATFLTVAAVLLLALAFGAGLLVGRFVL